MTPAQENVAKYYTYQIKWSANDNSWVGTCDGYSFLSHVANTPAEAIKGIIKLIVDASGVLK